MKFLFKGLFDDRKFYKTLFVLALPIIIQNLLMTSLNMADTIMTGALGDKAVAAVGIGNQVTFLIQLFMIGITAGCSIFVAQFWGNKDKENIKKVVGIGIISSIVVSIVAMAIIMLFSKDIGRIFSHDNEVIYLAGAYLKIVMPTYFTTAITLGLAYSLRSMEDAKSPMIISAIAVATNIVFNYIFIFGKFGIVAMGVQGAALATLIARVIECLLLIIIASKNEVLRGKIKHYLEFDKAFVKEVYKSVVPVLLNEACWGVGNFLYSVAYGQIGTEAMASVQICTNVQNIFMVLSMSMASASLVIIGNKIGAGEEEKARKYGDKITVLSLIIGVISGVIMILSAPAILSLFNVSVLVKSNSISILRIYAFLAPIRMINLVLIVGAFRGGGDAAYALKVEGLSMWLIGVPLAFIGSIFLGLTVSQVMILVSIEEIVKFLASVLRLRSGKWIKNVIATIEN
ncbi:MATE family efflux transporter [Clostridium massiliamazoniense]|uniref:MATE family efflux transporter n=1 Tax=Clostridium massiliamazoniense TaxID=1347366 RepID=UPI0006D7D664|nr:MATE family efflux transporter [Clostridium massiliamazoniense]